MNTGEHYVDAQVILKSADSLNHLQPQHLAIKSDFDTFQQELRDYTNRLEAHHQRCY
jgi:hypothetical protein